MLLVIGGMIGLGKTSVAELLGRHFNSEVFYESVDDNPILPLFYTSTAEDIEKHRYPFLLQLHFLDTRYRSIKKAMREDNNVLDRSIYEDWYFAKVNKELGRISELEFELYNRLLENMLEEIEDLPKKAPDLMIYLKGSFETVITHILKRGRSYEMDEQLKAYYQTLWQGYDEWIMNYYNASEVVVIDMDEVDIVNNPEDAAKVIEMVEEKLKQVRKC